MRSLLWLGLVWFGGCAKQADVRSYDNGLLELASSFAAKETCSCRFVMKRDEAFCREWVRVSPNVARPRIDEVNKTVTARSLGMAKATARFIDEQVGCTLDAP